MSIILQNFHSECGELPDSILVISLVTAGSTHLRLGVEVKELIGYLHTLDLISSPLTTMSIARIIRSVYYAIETLRSSKCLHISNITYIFSISTILKYDLLT
jgi:hypothetical protein